MIKSTAYDVIVIGAGASGLFCAFTAAQRGRKVLVLEKANKVGKKILMSGGGRCNFTNHFVEVDNFVGQFPHFAQAALWNFTQWDFIGMVERYGIAYEERDHSQLFCLDSAKDILAMLLQECQSNGVEITTHCDLQKVRAIVSDQTDKRYEIQVAHSERTYTLTAQSLVVASGGLSIPTLGGSGYGYELARQFGLEVLPLSAGLVPFMFSDATKLLCERLSGLAHRATVTCGEQSFTENILFTHRGLSGPAILQISNYWQPGDSVFIDLVPQQNMADWLCDIKDEQGKSLLRNVLAPFLAKPLVKELETLWWPQATNKKLAEFGNKQLREIGSNINHWQLKPSATEGYRTAEVTRGGVDTSALDAKTLEVKQQPGLFFIGEVVDITGHLGGFNFQWAWSSGYSAGLAV